MWFLSFTLTVDDRIDNLVPYEPLVIPYRLVKRYYNYPKHRSATNTSINTTKPTLISQYNNTTVAYSPENPAQDSTFTNPSSVPLVKSNYKKFYLYQNDASQLPKQILGHLLRHLPRGYPDEKQCRRDSKFSPEELPKIFRCRCLQNYSDVISTSKHGDLTIGRSPPPSICDFATILKSSK